MAEGAGLACEGEGTAARGELTDKHIYAATELLKKEFRDVTGNQSTKHSP